MIAFKLPDGSWSYMMTNNGASNKKVAVVYGKEDRAKTLSAYKITESLIPEDRAVVLPEAYASRGFFQGRVVRYASAHEFYRTFE